MRAAFYETSRRVDVELGFVVQKIFRDCNLHDLFDDVFFDLLVRDVRVVLRGNDHRIHSRRYAVVVFHGNLRFAVRAKIAYFTALSDFGETTGKLVRQNDCKRHKLFGFVGCKTEHHALIARADFVGFVALEFLRVVHALSNVRRLLVDCADNRASVAVKAQLAAVVADVLYNFSGNAGEVAIAFGGNFAHNQHQTRGCANFASHSGIFVFGNDVVQNGVGNLIADFVRMPFGYAFGCK